MALSLLYETLETAERLELPSERWQVDASIGEAHEERGEDGPSERAFGRAALVIRRLAARMFDLGLRERYFSAPQTRSVLERSRAQEAEPDYRIRYGIRANRAWAATCLRSYSFVCLPLPFRRWQSGPGPAGIAAPVCGHLTSVFTLLSRPYDTF